MFRYQISSHDARLNISIRRWCETHPIPNIIPVDIIIVLTIYIHTYVWRCIVDTLTSSSQWYTRVCKCNGIFNSKAFIYVYAIQMFSLKGLNVIKRRLQALERYTRHQTDWFAGEGKSRNPFSWKTIRCRHSNALAAMRNAHRYQTYKIYGWFVIEFASTADFGYRIRSPRYLCTLAVRMYARMYIHEPATDRNYTRWTCLDGNVYPCYFFLSFAHSSFPFFFRCGDFVGFLSRSENWRENGLSSFYIDIKPYIGFWILVLGARKSTLTTLSLAKLVFSI